MTGRPFYSTCVDWPGNLMNAKEWLDDHGGEISRAAFLAMVDRQQMRETERGLGYCVQLAMAEDYHVRYFADNTTGIPFFVHSATEYVFATGAEIEALERHALNRQFLEEEGILVIDRIGRMAGLPAYEPEADFDLQDEALERIVTHTGLLVVIDDETSAELPLHISLTIERALAHAGPGGGIRLWAGDAPPASWTGRSQPAPETDSNGRIAAAAVAATLGLKGEITLYSAFGNPELEAEPA